MWKRREKELYISGGKPFGSPAWPTTDVMWAELNTGLRGETEANDRANGGVAQILGGCEVVLLCERFWTFRRILGGCEVVFLCEWFWTFRRILQGLLDL